VPAALHQAQDESARLNSLYSRVQAELADAKQGLASAKQELLSAKQEVSRLLDVIQRRPRPLWEMLIFRRSGRPKKVFRRILFHKSGKPRGIFRKWILMPDGRPQAAFQMWMSSPEYQNMRGAVRFSAATHNAQVPLSPDAQQVARRVAALRPPSSRM
jgi:multidrug efflux pump subunit AcrA (membrane-fusion protein)